MELRLRRGADDDHLTVFLFVAALLHGLLILGIRFTAPPKSDPLPTLEVLLTTAGPNQEANLGASYIAERNQAGGGTTTDRVRTSLPEATPDLRDAQGSGTEEGTAVQQSRASLGGATTVSARALDASRALSGKEAVASATARAPLNVQPVPEIAVGAVAADSKLALRGRPLDDDRLLADTRESQIAAYLDGWKRRIERVGTLNFPNEARRRSLSGNPVLEVAISANGSLQQVLVRRSSGYSELDHAAMNIVRLASPFDPFPSSMRDSYPVLRFAYEWQFIRGRLGSGAVLSEEP
jgi:periplasmic protein TonB